MSSGKFAKMKYIGETVSIDKVNMLDTTQKIDKDLMEIGVDLRMDTLTVKVLHNPGIRVGQTLYLIEKNPDHISFKDGNIVGQIKVASIFETSFFGKQIRGEGYLRLIENKIMAVAMPIESESLDEALVLKKQGDYFITKGDTASAISYYKKSIQKDSQYPESHYALAKLHSNSGEGYLSAGFEYKIAWQNRNKFQDQEDKFQLHIDYMKFLIRKYEIESFKNNHPIQDLKTCISIGSEALKLSNKTMEIYYSLSYANFLLLVKTSGLTIGTNEIDAKQILENRKDKENFLSESEKNLEKAISITPQNYKVQMLAVLVYFEILKDLSNRNSKSKVSLSKELKSKIENHGRLYKTYKPKNKKFDKRISDILDVAKIFE